MNEERMQQYRDRETEKERKRESTRAPISRRIVGLLCEQENIADRRGKREEQRLSRGMISLSVRRGIRD